MSVHSLPEAEPLSPVKRALLEIRDLRARLAAAEAVRSAPIAIVGMGMRLPGGVRDAAGLAALLWSGTDAVGTIPASRWPVETLHASDPDAPGRMTTRHGAFLDEVDGFDASFFGISPREAASMDPQQRLLLEMAWEALEDAGQAPASLKGSRTGVYLGISNSDYGRALLARPALLDAYAGTGTAYSVAAGRLSYVLGLQGPSLAVDTACSSSLVALHLACQGLRLGECDLALAGGINLILTPEFNIVFSKARMLAPDGRCKTFDAAADGYVRGEGGGILVLRRLSDALAGQDRILAVLRGSAVNQDGSSGGLTAPSGPAQEAVIRSALQAAGVSPDTIGYVEAHGTGTPLGDPIEVAALGAVFGARDATLLLGALKSAIGHLEAAAGVAGVIKAVLALQRGTVPPNLHFRVGNPHVDWAGLPFTVPTAVTPLAPIGDRRLAGVSAFGFSGCNAHVVLEAPPVPVPQAHGSGRPLHLLPLSARSDAALRALAGAMMAVLPEDAPVAEICHTAAAGRSHFAHRLAITGATPAVLRRGLAAFAAGRSDPAMLSGMQDGVARPRVAFLFTGQGAQYAGMARTLCETSLTFRESLERCAEILDPLLPVGLMALLQGESAGGLHRTELAQPAIVAVEIALATLWRSWGIAPVAVLGHSLGEFAAACVAGVLSLEDVLRLVAERGRLTASLATGGGMAAVFAPEEEVATELARSGEALCIAAYNDPRHVVIAGDTTALTAALARFAAAGVSTKRLAMSYAAHSAAVDPVLPAFRQALRAARFQPQRISLVSNVTGGLTPDAALADPGHWLAQMRGPVRFAQSMATLAAQDISHCIEIGPHPVLLGMAADCVPSGMAWLPSLHRDRPDWTDLLAGLQRLYVDGADVEWSGFERDHPHRHVALPTYPFQRQRHWMDAASAPAPSAPRARLAAALDRQAAQGPLDLNAASYPAKWACAGRLAAAHAVRTFREVGLFARAGEAHAPDEVMRHAGFLPSYRRLVGRWLDRLAADGLLRAEAGRFVSDAPLPDPGLPALWAEAERLFADNLPLLAYLRHCGTLVGQVVRGKESPLETLFPGGSFTLAEGLYEHSATMRYVNALAAAGLGALADGSSPGAGLRVMEVGAGSGATTAALLPVLAPGCTRYRFTDVSDAFLDRARTRFAAREGMEFGVFDMDRDPPADMAGSWDVIVSANALHASTDLPAALRRLRTLLAPGGTLLLIESTTPFAWFDMSTGLIEGWQHFVDGLRTDQPLLSAEAWMDAMRQAGFEAPGAWPPAGSAGALLGQHVLVAHAAGEHRPEVAPRSAAAGAAAPSVVAPRPGPNLRDRMLNALPAERLDMLRAFVRAQVMHVLRRDPADPPGLRDRLMELGLDSLMAVQLRGRLGDLLAFDAPLPASLMFDHPTIDALAGHLHDRLFPPAPPTFAPMAVPSDQDIERLLLERLGGA